MLLDALHPRLDEVRQGPRIMGMANPPTRLSLRVEPPVAYLRIEGRATAPQTPAFVDALAELDRQGIERFVLDLSVCPYMDSTFSGQLARFALQTPPQSSSHRNIMLVNPNEAIVELLDTLYVLNLFGVLQEAEPTSTVTSLNVSVELNPEKSRMNTTCVQAHQILEALHPDNAKRFHDLLDYLKKQENQTTP